MQLYWIKGGQPSLRNSRFEKAIELRQGTHVGKIIPETKVVAHFGESRNNLDLVVFLSKAPVAPGAFLFSVFNLNTI